jgi:glucose-6-phosphate isomerase
MGYLPYSDAVEHAVGELRAALIERFGVATTWGYGPRFLHSTGQFHKGGPAVGVFLQLTETSDVDVAIPDRPFSFGQLIEAQANGDASVLAEHGRPVLTLTLTEASSNIAALTALLS